MEPQEPRRAESSVIECDPPVISKSVELPKVTASCAVCGTISSLIDGSVCEPCWEAEARSQCTIGRIQQKKNMGRPKSKPQTGLGVPLYKQIEQPDAPQGGVHAKPTLLIPVPEPEVRLHAMRAKWKPGQMFSIARPARGAITTGTLTQRLRDHGRPHSKLDGRDFLACIERDYPDAAAAVWNKLTSKQRGIAGLYFREPPGRSWDDAVNRPAIHGLTMEEIAVGRGITKAGVCMVVARIRRAYVVAGLPSPLPCKAGRKHQSEEARVEMISVRIKKSEPANNAKQLSAWDKVKMPADERWNRDIKSHIARLQKSERSTAEKLQEG